MKVTVNGAPGPNHSSVFVVVEGSIFLPVAIKADATVPPPTAATEEWNGTCWSEVNDLNTARYSLGGAGIQTAALAFGGTPPTTATEEWNGAGAPVTETITTS